MVFKGLLRKILSSGVCTGVYVSMKYYIMDK